MKKVFALMLAAVMMMAVLTSCGGDNASDTTTTGANGTEAPAGLTSDISVIAREEGSGTRGAFVELMGVVDEEENDITVASAEITNSTSVMMSTVAGNVNAIGYISLGSLNDTVKAVKVDGVAATVEDINNGSYKVSRPFVIATKGEVSELAQDFIDFIMSNDGQQIIEDEGYIKVEGSGEDYTASGLTGTVSLAGSTSVSPVMEKIGDAYKALNDGVTIEIQQTGSGAGITSTIEGACDIGMSSRALKEEEIAEGLEATTIATDGIAVIVNNDNPIEDISSESIKEIYLGNVTNWADVK